MREHVEIVIDVEGDSIRDFDRIKDQLLEIGRVQERINTDAESQARRSRQAASERNRAELQEKQAVSQADRNASNEEVARIRRETEEIRTKGNVEIAQIRETAARRSDAIRTQELAERRLARQQRNQFRETRRQQGGILRGFNGWSTALGTAAGIIGVDLIGALQRAGTQVFELTKRFEQLQQGYAAFLGSATIANQEISRLRTLADLPSVSFEGGVRASLQLQSAGFDFPTSERLIRELSNQVALFGGSTDALNRVLYQFVQTGGLQQFRQEELRQITEIVPGFRQVLTDVFGTFRGDEINKAIERMGLTFDQAMNRVLNRLEETARAPEDTLTNRTERLIEALNDLGRTIGTILTPVAKETIQIATDVVKGADTFFKFQASSQGQFAQQEFNKTMSAILGTTSTQGFAAMMAMYLLGTRYSDQPLPERYTQLLGETPPERRWYNPIDWWRNAADLLLPEGPQQRQEREYRQMLQRGGPPFDQYDLIKKSNEDIGKSLSNLFKSIRQFKKEGDLAKVVFETLTKGSKDLVKPLENLSKANQVRLKTLDDEYKSWIENSKQLDLSMEERKNRADRYHQEREQIMAVDSALKGLIDTRKQDFETTQKALTESIRTRLRNREFPEDVFAPDPIVGRKLPKFYIDPSLPKKEREELEKIIRKNMTDLYGRGGDLPGQFDEFSGTPIGTQRPMIPSTKRKPGDVSIDYPGTDKLQNLLTRGSLIADHEGKLVDPLELSKKILDETRAIKQVIDRSEGRLPTGIEVLNQGLNLPSGAETANIFLNPSELQDLKSMTRNLTNEWKTYGIVIGQILNQEDHVLSQLKIQRDELMRFRNQLLEIRSAFERIGGIPKQLGVEVEAAFKQASNALEKFNKEIHKLEKREAGRLITPPGQDQLRTRTRTFRPQADPRANAIQQYISRSGESLYDQFLAPSLLDLVGIGSSRSAARNRSLEDLKRSIDESRKEVRENATLNARQQAEELLEINREYERERREIERQYEEERSDAWKDWVRQQLTDIPKLIFEQTKLQISVKITNSILRSLGIGGGVPIGSGMMTPSQQAKSLLDFRFDLLGGAQAGSSAKSLASRFDLLGSSAAGLGTTLGTAGAIASGALAVHNIATGAIPGLNPHGQSLFGDLGMDLLAATGIKTFFDNVAYDNPLNDSMIREIGRQNAMERVAELGRNTARDMATNYDQGRKEGEQSFGTMKNPYEGMYIVSPDQEFMIKVDIGDRGIREIKFRMDEMIATGRLGGFNETGRASTTVRR